MTEPPIPVPASNNALAANLPASEATKHLALVAAGVLSTLANSVAAMGQ
jgi:hypothetical protein